MKTLCWHGFLSMTNGAGRGELCLLSGVLFGLILNVMTSRASAQIPTQKQLPLLSEYTQSDAEKQPLFWAQTSVWQTFLSMPRHPQTYRLDLGGVPHRHLDLSGQVSMKLSGFRRELYAQVNMAAHLNPAPSWQLSGGLHAGVRHLSFRFEDVVTEHPLGFTDLAHDEMRYLTGVSLKTTHTLPEYHQMGWQSQAFLESDGRTWTWYNQFFFHSPARPQNPYGLQGFIAHRYYQWREQTPEQTIGRRPQHYYLLGGQAELLEARLGFEAVYEASREVQTFVLGTHFTLCKGLSLHYDFNLPFRYDELQTGAPTHLLRLRYQLFRQTTTVPNPHVM